MLIKTEKVICTKYLYNPSSDRYVDIDSESAYTNYDNIVTERYDDYKNEIIPKKESIFTGRF